METASFIFSKALSRGVWAGSRTKSCFNEELCQLSHIFHSKQNSHDFRVNFKVPPQGGTLKNKLNILEYIII